MPDPMVVYLNGEFVARSEARLDVEDRGALFADGVYEVVRYFRGRALALPEHVARLHASVRAIELPDRPELARIGELSDELVRRNGLAEAKVYWQVTRGSAPREHAFPTGVRPTVLMLASSMPALQPDEPLRAIKAVLAEDQRWTQCWIKSLMLLPNVLAKNRALQAGGQEAILHREERITEGASTSVFVVRRGELWTHPADQWILGGITRAIVLALARASGITSHERSFLIDDLLGADEAFICSTTNLIAAVTQVDSETIGDGAAGPITTQLHAALRAHVAQQCP